MVKSPDEWVRYFCFFYGGYGLFIVNELAGGNEISLSFNKELCFFPENGRFFHHLFFYDIGEDGLTKRRISGEVQQFLFFSILRAFTLLFLLRTSSLLTS